MSPLIRTLFSILFWCLGVYSLPAQTGNANQPSTNVVYFLDGTIIKGTILDFKTGGNIVLLVGGQEVTLPASEVRKIGHTSKIIGLKRGVQKEDRKYAFSEKGLYHATGLMVNTGENRSGNTWGLGIQHVSGYHFNRWIGLGLGIGMDAYSLNEEKPVFSIFGDVRGYLTATRVAPFYSFQMGYGEMRNKEIRDVSGGLLVYPALGLRMSGTAGANLAVDLGYKYQKAGFEYDNPWWWQSFETWNYRYHRYVLRLSLTF